MRVAVVNLTAGGLSGGYLKYLKRLMPLLLRDPAIEALHVFGPESATARLANEPWLLETWPAADARRGFPDLRRRVRELDADVVFVPTARWLDVGRAKVVVMVRNMEPLEAPFGGNPPREALRNLMRRYAARRACRRAARVIAVSRHVREYVTKRWGIEDRRVGVVYHGADRPEPGSGGAAGGSLQGKVEPGFIFTAGSIRPARGLMDLVEALPRLSSPLQAVIAGHPDPSAVAHHRRLIDRARTLGVADRIHWTGSLTEPEMRWCYETCGVFVMTSRAEACPNVALEAMSHGCASVSVDHAPMPEFFESAALYYRAGDSTGLARRIDQVSSGGADAAALRAAAAARARAFDWQTTARRTVEELQAALGT